QAALDAERRQAMSYSVSTLLIRNLRDVFSENDPARRRAAIDEIYTEDCVFYDPSKGVYRGRDVPLRVRSGYNCSSVSIGLPPNKQSPPSVIRAHPPLPELLGGLGGQRLYDSDILQQLLRQAVPLS